MSAELKENILNLISYYNYHGIDKMRETHLGFIADDFKKLLAELEKEMEL